MENKDYGRYTLLKKLATGGMAEVFLARQKGLEGFEKLLVIKRILPHLADDEEFVEMFLNEARIAARFNHPNIVQIYDLGKEEDTYFIAMEFIHGEDLGRIMREAWRANSWVPIPTALRIAAAACEGLFYAHTKTDEHGNPLQVVHRDISPQNIIVSFDGGVKLVDFGIARAANQSSTTKSGAIKGKYAYMSPEQASGKVVDHRSDIFAMGLVLFELLTGVRPLKRDNEILTLKAAVDCVFPKPSEVAQVPPELDALVLKALSRVADDRYPDARAFQLAIEEFLVSHRLNASTVHISEMMRQLFSARLAEEAKLGEPVMLRSETTGTPIAPIDPNASSVDVLLPRLPTRSGKQQPADGTPSLPVLPSGEYQLQSALPAAEELIAEPAGFEEAWEAPPGPMAPAVRRRTVSGVHAAVPEYAPAAAPPRRASSIGHPVAADPAAAPASHPPRRRVTGESLPEAAPRRRMTGESLPAEQAPRRRATGEVGQVPPPRRHSNPGVAPADRASGEARRRSRLYMTEDELASDRRRVEERQAEQAERPPEDEVDDEPSRNERQRARRHRREGHGGLIGFLLLLIAALGAAAVYLKPELRSQLEAFVGAVRTSGALSGQLDSPDGGTRLAVLDLDSNVPVEVFLGEEKLGTTPVKGARIPVGRLALKLVNPNLGIERAVTVTGEEGETVSHRETFAMGRVRFVAEKECEVFINDRRIARTPGPALDFFEGLYEFECRNAPLKLVDRAKARIPKDQDRVVEVRFNLRPM